MSEGEVLPPAVPFSRGCKARASLPVGRSSGQTRERPLGVLYLQYGEETKQVRMPADISSQEALWALFVTAFPHQLTMKMLQSPNMAIYIKDTSRNVYYDLDDIRNITPHCCLKVYHKDPAQVFIRHTRSASTEGRISKEVLYGSHSPVHTLSSSSRSTLHSLQGSMSPPMVRSVPSSPSRMAYGSSRGGAGAVDPGNATLPRERLSGAGRSSSVCTSSSVILERRDVKPDEDVGSSKSMALVVRGEGGPHYPDSYCSSLQDGGGGRLSFASSQCSAPPSVTADMVDAGVPGVPGIPGVLHQYRASVKPLMGYGESTEHPTHSLHRQKSRKYGESQLPSLGTKTPPSSPHRVSEVRMIDGQVAGGVGLVSAERMSPIRRSLRRDSNGATVEIINRSRGSGSSSSTSSVFVDSPLGQPERLFQGHVTASNTQSERMKAMEEQIASLAGLVHHALSMGPDVPGVKDAISESAGRKLLNNRPVSSEPQNSTALIDSFSPAPLALQAPPSGGGLQQSLVLAKRSVCELRLQLSQLRQLQLLNQESVSSMLRMAGQELVGLMCDRLARSEEAAHGRRAELDEERIHYLATEDRILSQLSELEDYVDRLQRSSASDPGQLSITLRDVEEGAVSLRRVGEALAVLKGEFPELQVRMRSVLRVEVEAVRFLKEEPHKMDSMLKRVKALTETLSSLRRCVSESTPPGRPAQVEPLKHLETEGPPRTQSPQSSPKPQPRSSVRPPLQTPPLSGTEVSVGGSASPVMTRKMTSTAATVIQPPHHPSPPLTPTHGRDSPTVAKVSPRSREGSPALHRRPPPPQSDGLCSPAGGAPTQETQTEQTPATHTQTHTQTSRTDADERPPSSDSSQPPDTNADLDQVLQEAQASLMKSIPDLDVSDTREGVSDPPPGQNLPLDPAQQASVEQLSDQVDSTDTAPPDVEPPPPAPQSAASVAAESAPPSAVSSGRPQVEKPRRSSVDKEMRQSPDRSHRSSPPPPPPPRRFHAVSSGVTTGRSGEVIFTTRREPAGAQEEKQDKEPPPVPQAKPPRQPPEVKPKPQMCAPAPLAGSTSTPAPTSAHREEEEEEEEEGGEEGEEEEEDNRFIKELQVFQKCSVRGEGSRGGVDPSASQLQSKETQSEVTTELSKKNKLPGGNKQWKGKLRKSSASQVANQKPPELATCDHQSFRPAAGPEDQGGGGKDGVSLYQRRGAGQKLVQQGSSLNRATVEKVELPPPVALQDAQLTLNRELVGKVSSPTTAENKVKVTTIVTLQKVQSGGSEPPGPEQTLGDKKSNMMVIVTLQKENSPGDCSSLSSDQERLPPFPKPPPLPPIPTLSHSNKQQNQETAVQGRRDWSQYTEEGGSLSPDRWDDEGPPPPPPPNCDISLRMSKTRVGAQSKEEDLVQMNGFDTQTGESTRLAHEDQSNDKRPIIVILDEPMDIQSAYKRLSTIFESEEDLNGILTPESVVDEEQTRHEEEEQGLRKLCIAEIKHQRPDTDSAFENQDLGKADSPRKTETKKKFKFKFPKNKLAAITQAIRTGTKTGKKTLNVVVYEEEEEEEMASDSRLVKETKNQTKESRSCEINRTKHLNSCEGNSCDRDLKVSSPRLSLSHSQVEELCKTTLHSVGNLEESIKQLEISVGRISNPSSPPSVQSAPPQSPAASDDRAQIKGKVKRERDRSPSKRPAPQILKGPNPPQSKRAKPQPAHDTGKTSSKKKTSSNISSSSALRSHTRSRHSSSSPEKSPKAQKQQKQPSQAVSRSSRAAGDSNRCVVALRPSKIPALYHSSGKHPSASLSTSPSGWSSPSSAQRSRRQASLCPLSSSSLAKSSSSLSLSDSPPRSPSPPPPSFSSSPPLHKSLIPSLNLSRLLPSSSHVLSPSHANTSSAHHGLRSSSNRQQHLVLASTSTSSTTSTSQHSYYSSSSYSSSSPSSSSTSSSLSPTSSSSSPPSPSSSLLPTMVSHGTRSVRVSESDPGSPCPGRKCTGSQGGRLVRAAAASRDLA
ncbi:sickle tail protein-like [Seriola lalandi dorsalis]|uniref:sickle tail protein-like n=1 Tax=Seriola lalandi dorsalis TaxID=1841481 RepID=UPI000C6F583C|nr:sickle tail protein-like [Seriola lalandi dorsalis]